MWFNRLRHRFSPRRIRLGHNGIQPLSSGESGALVCLVGRELCLFLEVNAEKVPAKQRPAFVATSVRRNAPFPDPDFGLSWEGGHASIWYWSRSRAQGLLGNVPSRVKYFPEALFIDRAHDDHVQLLALEAGIEGRVWRQGRLIASRWWPDVPEQSTWFSFLRGAGHVVDATAGVPMAEHAMIAPEQWNASNVNQKLLLPELGPYLPRLILAFGLVVTVVLGWQIGSIIRAQIDSWRANAAAQDMDDTLRSILDARSNTDTYRAEIDQLLELRQSVPQNQLLAEYSRLATGKEWQIKLWRQPAPDRLEVTLTMSNPDPELLVSNWEASPLFKDVSTQLSRQQNEVTINAFIEQGANSENAATAAAQSTEDAAAPTSPTSAPPPPGRQGTSSPARTDTQAMPPEQASTRQAPPTPPPPMVGK